MTDTMGSIMARKSKSAIPLGNSLPSYLAVMAIAMSLLFSCEGTNSSKRNSNSSTSIPSADKQSDNINDSSKSKKIPAGKGPFTNKKAQPTKAPVPEGTRPQIRTPSPLQEYHENVKPSLAYYCRSGDIENVRLMLEKGADPNERIEGLNHTPLNQAIIFGHDEIFLLLLEKGADINDKNINGTSSLQTAASNGQVKISKILIEKGLRVNHKNNRGDTPLHNASSGGHKPFAELLLSSGAKINARNKNNETPLLLALRRKKIELASYLIDQGAKVNIVSNDGMSPLILSLYHSDELTIKLLEKGADPNAKFNDLTPLDIALKNRRPSLVKLLKKYGAKPGVEKGFESTALHKALSEWTYNNQIELITKNEYIEGLKEIIKRNPSSVNVQDVDRNTPLHLAIELENLFVTELLLEHGANVNLANKNGQTPIFIAIKNGSAELARILLEQDADVNIQDSRGDTPLHYAVESFRFDVVKMLISHGAQADVKNKFGKTPLQIAKDRDSFEMSVILGDYGDGQ